MKEHYHTLHLPGEGLYKEKGSRFFGFAYTVQDEEDVKKRLDELKKRFFDARHHCYAWVLGQEGESYRANDDGEPNHSAGDPILGQIRSRTLTYVLVVVVRYFGGTKLGVGGLITAYKAAAAAALDSASQVTVIMKKSYVLQFPYEATSEVMRLVKETDAVVEHQEFLATCTLQVGVRLAMVEPFQKKLKLLNDLGIEITGHLVPGGSF
jgi:uncharacterized YigZ family protein